MRAAQAADVGIDTRSASGATALHIAAENGNADGIIVLLGAGASAAAADLWGETAVHRAAVEGHVDCPRPLVRAGADVNAATNSGMTALHLAASRGHGNCLQVLLVAGADVNAAYKADDGASRGSQAVPQIKSWHDLGQYMVYAGCCTVYHFFGGGWWSNLARAALHAGVTPLELAIGGNHARVHRHVEGGRSSWGC